jgi:hypothetical protein
MLPASIRCRHPPICLAATLPLARRRCDHFTTLATLTPNSAAVFRQVRAPPPNRPRDPAGLVNTVCHPMLTRPSQHLQSQNPKEGNPLFDSAF